MYIYHLYGLKHGEQRYAYILSVDTDIDAQNKMRELQYNPYKDIVIFCRRKCLNILPTAFLDQQARVIFASNDITVNTCGAI